MPYPQDATGRRKRPPHHNVHLADGRTMVLTEGERNAVRAWIEANGRTGYLSPPDNMPVDMTRRMVVLGLIAWVRPGMARWCPGVLELSDPIDHAPAFSFAGRVKG